MLDRLPDKPVVTRGGERDESRHRGVAGVLELLPVRRVHVGLERPDASAVPVHAPPFREPGQVAAELPTLHEWIRGEDSVQIVYAEWLVASGDVELDVAERAPVQGSEP